MPGLPTTIFWILAAFCFLRVNRRAYDRLIGHKRFGPAVRLFVEEGRISARGKLISIVAMMACATIGAFALPGLWLKVLIVGLASAGSLWVGLLPTPGRSEELVSKEL